MAVTSAGGHRSGDSTLAIGVLLPEVLGTYGDTGNAWILRERARRRGLDAQVVLIDLDTPIPESLDLYTMGGGEDTAQALAAEKFDREPGLRRALAAGRPLLAICASLQVLGHWYRDAQGRRVSGMGVLDVTTDPQGHRSIGELVSAPLVDGLTDPLTGFENHGGGTVLGPDAAPLGRVVSGTGNGTPEGATPSAVATDGAVQGPIVATYMHGPALARNPQLADLLLARAVGQDLASLDPLDVPGVDALRAERLHEGRASAPVSEARSAR